MSDRQAWHVQSLYQISTTCRHSGRHSSRPDQLAIQSGLIVRQSAKFSAQGFLLTLLKAVSTGHASFSQMAVSLGDTQTKTLSRQALHQRIKPEAIGFLESVLHEVIASPVIASGKRHELPFARILLEDATQFRMHPENSGSFRAVANKSCTTAGAKIDVIIDLVSGRLLRQKDVEGHVQDRTLGPELLPMIRKGDLVIRDMGYFDVAGFAGIEARKAFWLSRLHGQAGVTLADGRSLESHLASAKCQRLEARIALTQRGHPARLVAFRASAEVAAIRRRKKKDKRKRNGTRASKQALAREAWNILVTNIPAHMCTAKELARLYRQRWDIEIQFRAWKQSLHMHKALHRITGKLHLEALMLAAMIFSAMAMQTKLLIASARPDMRISSEKLFGWLSGRLKLLKGLFCEIPFDPRHPCRCKRKRKTLRQNGYDFVPLN